MSLEVTQHQTTDGNEATAGSSRRSVLRAAGVGGAAVAVGLTAAACGNSSSTPANDAPAQGGANAGSSTTSSGSGGSGSAIAQTSQIPVDGGMVVTADNGTVVTQPASGTYKAFSAICTHAGCIVGSVANNQIMCPCHGSVYSATDGSVVQGPAPSPLPAKKISVSGGQIFLAS